MHNKATERNWIDILLWVLLVVLIVVSCLRIFVFVQIDVSGLSMYPTLDDGDKVWGSKISSVDRGDIVVFTHGDDVLIKRAVAVAGDKVWVELVDGQYVLYILTTEGDTITEQYSYNGQDVVVSAMDSVGFLSGYDSIDNSYTIDDGQLLPMGDNRAISYDGRDFGTIDVTAVMAVII